MQPFFGWQDLSEESLQFSLVIATSNILPCRNFKKEPGTIQISAHFIYQELNLFFSLMTQKVQWHIFI